MRETKRGGTAVAAVAAGGDQEQRDHGPGGIVQVTNSAYPEEEMGTGYMRCDIACVISIGFVAHLAIACDCKRSHAIACDRMRSRKNTFLSRLSEFLKMHREREAGQKVCLKCFFTTTVNRFHLLFFSPFSKRKK